MWDLIPNLLPNWLVGLGLVPIALLIGAAVLFGLAPVVGVAGKAGELALKVLDKVWDGVVWTFSNIFAPGLKNIAENGSSIITVLAMGAALYWVVDLQNIKTERQLRATQSYLTSELTGFKATLGKTRQELAQCKQMVNKVMKK